MSPSLKMLKAFFKEESHTQWKYGVCFLLLSYLGQIPLLQDLAGYLDSAFLLVQPLTPFWVPALWGGVMDLLYQNPLGMTPLIFLVCQIFAYFLKNVWRYKWIYMGVALALIVVIQSFLTKWIYHDPLPISGKSLLISVGLFLLVEPIFFCIKHFRKKISSHKIKRFYAHSSKTKVRKKNNIRNKI